MNRIETALAIVALTALAVAAEQAPLTYHKDIQPILARRCVGCHQPGEIGPMALTSYKEVRPWAKAIKEAALRRVMPPWYADPAIGTKFLNDRSLTEEEIRSIVSWVDSGAEPGASVENDTEVTSADTSRPLRKPDLVIRVPALPVPATGTMEYTFLVTALNFEEDKWIEEAEWRIDQRQLVHHMNAFVRPPGSSYVATAPYGQPYVASKTERLARRPDETENDRRELLIGYEPGYRPAPWGADRAKLIKRGSDMVFEMHYTTERHCGHGLI